jgi:hypothetical protein
MSNDSTRTVYPEMVMGEAECPLEGCDVLIPIRASLVIRSSTVDDGVAHFRVGVDVNSSGVELHMIEHGLDVISGEVES